MVTRFAQLPTSKAKKLLKVGSSLFVLVVLLSSSIAAASQALTFSNGQNASIVIGQTDFNSRQYGTTQATLSAPGGLAFDSSGNLWVADSANGRVLEFNAPFSTGEAASIVLGEPDFTTSSICLGNSIVNSSCLTTPSALTFDSSGNLWVSDAGNNRILEFKAPFANYKSASLVIGQPDLTTGSNPDSTPSQSDLNNPAGLAFDPSGNLWVADAGYNRVLEFSAPLSTGESASVVIGQSNFTAGIWQNIPGCPPNCGGATRSSLNGPGDVAFDSSGNLWVADSHDDRVLKFNPPFSTGQGAALVLGSSSFTSGAGFCTSQSCFDTPEFLTFDHSGTLWVADTVNYRVVSIAPPFANGENESVVLGEPDFVTSGPPSGQVNATSSDMNAPYGIAFDPSGNVWVSDQGSNRVLEFVPSASATSSTSTSVASSVSTSSTSSQVSTSVTMASFSTTTTSSSQLLSSQASSATSSSGGGGSVPEFPYQLVVAAVFTLLLATTYLLVRRRTVSDSTMT